MSDVVATAVTVGAGRPGKHQKRRGSSEWCARAAAAPKILCVLSVQDTELPTYGGGRAVAVARPQNDDDEHRLLERTRLGSIRVTYSPERDRPSAADVRAHYNSSYFIFITLIRKHSARPAVTTLPACQYERSGYDGSARRGVYERRELLSGLGSVVGYALLRVNTDGAV